MGINQYDDDDDGQRVANLAAYEHYVYEQHQRAATSDATDPSCTHESGTRYQAYDGDGWGYYVWVCDGCGFKAIDTGP